jgi:hypothetical protein
MSDEKKDKKPSKAQAKLKIKGTPDQGAVKKLAFGWTKKEN